MNQWNAAVIGAGFIGRVHLEAIRRLGHVQIVALADPELDKAKQLGAELSIGCVAANFQDILRDLAIDAVHVITPNHLHFPVAKVALETGKHVICEKPLATSVEDAKVLVAAAARAGKRNCLCHNLRYYSAVQQTRRLCETGELGEILVVQGTYSQDWLAEDTDWNWRGLSSSGGPSRCMADIGSHWFDMAEHVTGCRVSTLWADLQTFHKTRRRPKAAVETFAGKLLGGAGHEGIYGRAKPGMDLPHVRLRAWRRMVARVRIHSAHVRVRLRAFNRARRQSAFGGRGSYEGGSFP